MSRLMLVVAMVLAWQSPVAAQTLPGMSPQMTEMQHCRALLERAPAQALALADTIQARAPGNQEVLAGALGCRMLAYMFTGNPERVAATATELEALLDKPGLPDTGRVNALLELARATDFLGQPQRSTLHLEEALALGEAMQAPTVRLNALVHLSTTHATLLRDPAGAEPYLQEAIAIVGSLRRPALPPDVGLHLGYASILLELQRPDEARVQVEHAGRIVRSLPDAEALRSRVVGTRGLVELESGQHALARQHLQEALRIQQRLGDRLGEVATLLFLAKVELRAGKPELALAGTTQALEAAEQGQGGPQLLDQALTQMIEVQRALGNEAEAAQLQQRFDAISARNAAALEAPVERMRQRATAAPSRTEDLAWHQREFARNSLLMVLGVAVLACVIALARLRRRQRGLAELGGIDPLTGLLNRRAATQRIQALAPASGERRHALLLVDVDRFKAINDRQGHVAGDGILVRIANVLRGACDEDDIVARWGGEEFLVVRPHTSQSAAFALAEHLRDRIQRAEGLADDAGLVVTASLGLAPFPFFPDAGQGDWQDALRLADRALYVAKHAGRNAWAAMWGLPEGCGVDLHDVRGNPEAALAQGWIAIGGNRPMSWAQPRTTNADPGSDDRAGLVGAPDRRAGQRHAG
ncbi:diguanylate cyclase domain-containing protein [Pseudoxanthomonas koreensis]|uniref:GGDEF domain-containing protein n=1 Tax=Pseudoxanthomonas koreensis TaxID=266061 RepID=UPI0035A6B3CC